MKLASFGVVALFSVGTAQGQVQVDIELPLVGDTFVNGNAPNTVFGDTAEPLYVHTYGPKYVLLQFDTALLEGALRVQSARLVLSKTSVQSSGTMYAHATTSSWNENTVTYNSLPAYEAQAVDSVSVFPNPEPTLALRLTDAIDRWLDGTLPPGPLGLLLRTDDPVRALFQSKENGVGATLSMTATYAELPRRPLDLSSLPVVLDEPGLYYLDRNWDLGRQAGSGGTVIFVEANGVDVDFQQHTVGFSHEGTGIQVYGDDFTLRNGTFNGDLESTVVRSEGDFTTVEDMYMYSYSGIHLTGRGSRVDHSEIVGRFGSSFGSSAQVNSNEFSCFAYCVSVSGDRARVRANVIGVGTENALRVIGSNNIVEDNFIGAGTESFDLISVTGNDNDILDNRIASTSDDNVLLLIDGTRNRIDGNNAIPREVDRSNSVGIRFVQDGNYYGDNRMTGVVPYDLGSTVQTDWGGNVGF